MIHIHNLEVENKEDIKNFLQQSNIFSSHKLQTGNASNMATIPIYLDPLPSLSTQI